VGVRRRHRVDGPPGSICQRVPDAVRGHSDDHRLHRRGGRHAGRVLACGPQHGARVYEGKARGEHSVLPVVKPLPFPPCGTLALEAANSQPPSPHKSPLSPRQILKFTAAWPRCMEHASTHPPCPTPLQVLEFTAAWKAKAEGTPIYPLSMPHRYHG
jgi:hypothetical protein